MNLVDFDRIACVCIDYRANEWSKLEKQLNSKNCKMERFIVGKGKRFPKDFYHQIDPTEISKEHNWGNFSLNAYCCHLSHRKILENAKKDNIKNILMLEDDCKLLEQFDDILEKVSQQINELNIKWDMLYFGSNHTWGKTRQISENILKLYGGTYCWHCVGINQEHHNMIEHLLSLPISGPFDWLTSIYTQTNQSFNCYAIWPTIAIQSPGISYVLGSIQDYTEWFKNKGSAV